MRPAQYDQHGSQLALYHCRRPVSYTHLPQLLSPQELVNRLCRFKPYYGDEGGVTFSGGEPLLQKEFLQEVLPLCRQAGIHTCLCLLYTSRCV